MADRNVCHLVKDGRQECLPHGLKPLHRDYRNTTMARYVDSVCQLCRREGIKLYLKGSRCESPKCAVVRRKAGNSVVAPGMHGFRRGKSSEYGVRLREKQKVKRFYGILERQFRRYFELASRSPENTGE